MGEVEKQYLTPKELQVILQLGRNKIYQLCSLKGFPAIKFGSTYRIDKQKFLKWLEKHEGMNIDLN